MYRILADENMPLVEELFSSVASSIKSMPGRAIQQKDLLDIDVLLVRSITKVNASLLTNTKVKFVGSATIGTDHIDQSYLATQNIAFSNSPGCNADGVVDYVIAALCHWQQQTGQIWRDKKIAVIGCGNVGGRLADRLIAAGISTWRNDPFRKNRGEPGFCTFDEALSADIICLHTPLTNSGAHPTKHLLNEIAISKIKAGALIISAGRGPVIDEQALKSRLSEHNDLSLVLDVWESEPNPDKWLLKTSLLSTPHIAGYSLDGKIRGTWMLREALAKWAKIDSRDEPVSTLNMPENYQWQNDISTDANISNAVEQVLNLKGDSQSTLDALSDIEDSGEVGQKFDMLRKEYPVRRELSCLLVKNVPESEQALVKALGFQC